MANRFTATEKWVDPWFCNLNEKDKLFWIYLVDNCDHAGIWQVNWPLVRFHIKDYIFDEKVFNGRIMKLKEDKWFIPKFIDFQYKTGLNPENRAHQSVITILKKEGAYKGLIRGIKGRKDMDMVKDMVLDKDKEDSIRGVIGGIINDLNEVLGTSYKTTSHKTNELIQARLNEGFTLEDFKVVHRKMLKAWGADSKMVDYLRPITLYSNKFESYFNKKDVPTKLTQEGVKAYLIGKSWLEKSEVVDVR